MITPEVSACPPVPTPSLALAPFSSRGASSCFQMVHTEPFFSRKDDVPERRREFAGKVFRIPHKNDLQVRRDRNDAWVCFFLHGTSRACWSPSVRREAVRVIDSCRREAARVHTLLWVINT